MLREITYETPDGLIFTENVEVDGDKPSTVYLEQEVEYIGKIKSGLLRDKDAALLRTKDGETLVGFYNSHKDVYQPSIYHERSMSDPSIFEKQELRDQLIDMIHNSQLNPLSDSFISDVFDFMRKHNIHTVKHDTYSIETIPNMFSIYLYVIRNEEIQVVHYNKQENEYELLLKIRMKKK